MKNIVLITFLGLFSIGIQAQEIKWVSLNEALQLQKKEPRKIFMDVYTNWCGPCKMLDKNTFHNKDVVDYVNKNYYAVKFDAEGNSTIKYDGKTFSNPNYNPDLVNKRNGVHDLTMYLKIGAYPSMVFFNEESQVLTAIKGYQNPQQLELYLKLFKNNDHKDLKTQEDFNAYFTAFTPTFKGE
ncbi:Thioredoxin-related protein [Flavobacteriaceae bacterium MAR_2010_188]|nr:Thioredoxin-related protein [Flavobacteriaceae bacterium MAR_2010_188]